MSGSARSLRPKKQRDPEAVIRVLVGTVIALILIVIAVSTVDGLLWRQSRHSIARISKLEASNRNLSLANKKAIEEINKFRAERAKLTSETARQLCEANNAQNEVLRGVIVPTRAQLLATAYYRDHPEEIDSAIKNAHKIATKFKARDCSSLPTAKLAPKPTP